jgi:hypothetical protein
MSKQAGFLMCACVLLVGLMVAPLVGQPANGDRQGGRGARGGQFDREAMQQRIAQIMRERLGASEEEWAVLGPRIQKVMALRQQTAVRGGFGDFGGRRGGPGAGGDAQRDQADQPPVVATSARLRELLDDESTDAATIKAAMQALRDARVKAQQELIEAQTQLRELLSLRQEATLLTMGMLD